MYNVTLISTEHRASGKCNSDELYNIIETINPDVIFEEETDDEKFQEYYNDVNSFNSLEVQTIKKYIQNHDIKHIPVDIETNFNYKEWDYMFETFKRYDVYKQAIKEHCELRNRDSFSYLNSERCSELLDKTKMIERQLIEFSGINRNEFLRIYSSFHEEHHNREKAMIVNIYNYSKENKYNQAVFLIGYAHRKSIIEKIRKYEPKETFKLNWTFYNDK